MSGSQVIPVETRKPPDLSFYIGGGSLVLGEKDYLRWLSSLNNIL